MKAFNTSLRYYIVQTLRVSNKLAIQYILEGTVLVNGLKGTLHQPIQLTDEVTFRNSILQSSSPLLYIAYYKPHGVESTLNLQVKNNLAAALNLPYHVFPVGRLDKASEGLMLLTNDGSLYNSIVHADAEQEKEYIVIVDKPLTAFALEKLAAGVTIMGKTTRPAKVALLSTSTFSIVLTQGLNRQIRRMCYKLGLEVLQLIRIRISGLTLGDLQPGHWRHTTPHEIKDISLLQV